MKPWHAGLLAVGAALAGGLAVKMSQPPATSAAAPPAASVTVPPAPPKTVTVEAPPAVTAAPLAAAQAPPPVYAEPERAEKTASAAKPSPLAKPLVAAKPLVPAKPSPQATQLAHAQPAPPMAEKTSAVPAPVAYQEPPVSSTPATVSAPAPAPEPDRAPEPPPARQVTLQSGTALPVRVLQTITSDRATAGDTFQATLAEPLVIDGLVVAERGARVSGRVVEARTAGKFSGSSALQLSLSSLQTADGQKIGITTEPWAKESDANARGRNDAARIGGGAALGAIIGAISGGGAGAAIGAGVGGAAGAGSIAISRPKPVEVQTETLIRFRLAARVTITERPPL